jgi:hypothetical protein
MYLLITVYGMNKLMKLQLQVMVFGNLDKVGILSFVQFVPSGVLPFST